MGNNDIKRYLELISDENRRNECLTLIKIMREITGEEPEIWSNGIVGFGRYHYKYESGREGDWFLTGFSSRKKNLVVYITAGFDQYEDLMSSLGKYKTGKSCLYIQKLDEIDMEVLSELIRVSVHEMKYRYR